MRDSTSSCSAASDSATNPGLLQHAARVRERGGAARRWAAPARAAAATGGRAAAGAGLGCSLKKRRSQHNSKAGACVLERFSIQNKRQMTNEQCLEPCLNLRVFFFSENEEEARKRAKYACFTVQTVCDLCERSGRTPHPQPRVGRPLPRRWGSA